MLLANALSLIVCTVVGAYGLADGGPPKYVEGFITYLVLQLLWLVMTIFLVGSQAAKQTKV